MSAKRIRFGLLVCCLLALGSRVLAGEPVKPFEIDVVDKDSRWPVPMVDLATVHNVHFVTDNAGRVAFDLPELMGQETWLEVSSDGYEVPADGFGRRGVRVTPAPGKKFTLEINRTSIAKRIGRVTGAGLFGESQKLGLETDWQESHALGSDSVQNAIYNGRMYWAWGDTSIARYPLGIFNSTGATTAIRPLTRFEPPLRLNLEYVTDAMGQPRGIAEMPGPGPTWLVGFVTLPDKAGHERLGATYMKIKPPMEVYETGLCVWNDSQNNFEHLRTLWTQADASQKHPPMPRGHSVIFNGDDGQKWALFGDPLPVLKCPATFEAWQEPTKWEVLKPQKTLASSTDGKPVTPGAGSIAWNAYRQRWVTVFLQALGSPSAFGEIWYAEAKTPFGPWGPAVKVLSHKNYAFYNPAMHPEFTPPDSPVLLFEGTHSATFRQSPGADAAVRVQSDLVPHRFG